MRPLLRGFYHRKYRGIYRHAKKLFVFDLVLLGAAFLMLGAGLFFFFWEPSLAGLIDLSVSLGNSRVRSGDKVHLTIDYVNHGKYALRETRLSLHLPPGFIIDREKTPETIFSADSIFPIEKIEAGAKGQLEIFGRLWSDIATEDRIIAGLSYRPEHKKEREQKLASLIINLPESVLTSHLSIATTSLPNSYLPFAFNLTNSGDDRVDKIKVLHNWPSQITDDDSVLKDISLDSRANRIFNGRLWIPPEGERLPLQITVQVSANNHTFTQTTIRREVELLSPRLFSAVKILNDKPYIEARQIVPIEINWKNDSQSNFQDLKLRLSFTPLTVDLPASARANRLKIENNDLIIDGANRTALSNSQPGKNDSFALNIQLLPHLTLGNAANAYWRVTPTIEGQLPEIPDQIIRQSGVPASMPIATELAMSASTRYYTAEGDQLGRGPLPPRPGETTKYWIFARLLNTSNNVTGASFQTTLPPGVEFGGRQSVTIGPPLQYDPARRAVTWNCDELPSNSQTGLYFEVAATPAPEQIGKTLQLTNNLYFSAADSWTGKQFSLSQTGLTNVLSADDQGAAKGAVVVNVGD